MKKKLGGAGCRRKGHQFERTVAILLRHIFPNARRHLEYQDGQCKGYDLAEVGHYRIQTKKLRAYASVATINEVQAQRPQEMPVLITAGDSLEPMAVIPLSDWLKLVECYEKNKPQQGFVYIGVPS